jgi:hypothetical protein
MDDRPAGSHEREFMEQTKQEIFSSAVGIARLRLHQGDVQGASDVLDDACDKAHIKHWDACLADGHSPERITFLLGLRAKTVERNTGLPTVQGDVSVR